MSVFFAANDCKIIKLFSSFHAEPPPAAGFILYCTRPYESLSSTIKTLNDKPSMKYAALTCIFFFNLMIFCIYLVVKLTSNLLRGEIFHDNRDHRPSKNIHKKADS